MKGYFERLRLRRFRFKEVGLGEDSPGRLEEDRKILKSKIFEISISDNSIYNEFNGYSNMDPFQGDHKFTVVAATASMPCGSRNNRSDPKKYNYISLILREYQELNFNSCTYLIFTNCEDVLVSLLSVIAVNGAEGLPKYASSGEGVEVCDFDNRGVERSYVPTKRSKYM
uniref:Uncharacterized protein n=1 Tax=Tanacetum cinerariifolium TaxID=118510 RepID=A0A6L2K2L1_TANCI|nr:hypothetical protein [Tanacetum cinerariifolium]